MSSENEEGVEIISQRSLQLMRAFTDPIVLPHHSSTAPAPIREQVVDARLIRLDRTEGETVDVATWPETAIWLSELSLIDGGMASSSEGAKMCGFAFSEMVQVCEVPIDDSVLESISEIIPDDPSDFLLRKITKLRRLIRRTQHEKFLEEIYPDLKTKVPKSFWDTDSPVTGYPINIS